MLILRAVNSMKPRVICRAPPLGTHNCPANREHVNCCLSGGTHFLNSHAPSSYRYPQSVTVNCLQFATSWHTLTHYMLLPGGTQMPCFCALIPRWFFIFGSRLISFPLVAFPGFFRKWAKCLQSGVLPPLSSSTPSFLKPQTPIGRR